MVLGIAEARSTLSSIVEKLTTDGTGRVVIGSHRKAEAMIVPFSFETMRPSQPGLLELVRSKSVLVKRLAGLSRIGSVSVFGSVARGDYGPESDIDFLVETLPGATLFDIAAFEIDMETLFDRKVDAISIGSLDRQKDARIFAESIPL